MDTAPAFQPVVPPGLLTVFPAIATPDVLAQVTLSAFTRETLEIEAPTENRVEVTARG